MLRIFLPTEGQEKHDSTQNSGPLSGPSLMEFQPRQLGFATQKMTGSPKLAFHHAWQSFKNTTHGNVVKYFYRLHRRHLADAVLRHPLVGVQNKDIHVFAAAAAFDGGRTGITEVGGP